MKSLKNKVCYILMITLCFSVFIFTGCKNVKYKVSFMVDNLLYTEVSAVSGKSINMPVEPTKTGYTFEGWYMSNELEAGTFSNIAVKRDIVVYARFTPKTYNVELNLNGGVCDITNLELVYDKEFTLPIPTKEKHKFVGWYYEDILINGNVWVYEVDELYAKWEFIEYNVGENELEVIVNASEIIPLDSKFIGQLNINVNNTVESYVFVNVDCDNKEYLSFLEFNTQIFQKYKGKYYYLAPKNTSTIVFADTITLSSNVGNEFFNIGNITLKFEVDIIQSQGLSLETAYSTLFGE